MWVVFWTARLLSALDSCHFDAHKATTTTCGRTHDLKHSRLCALTRSPAWNMRARALTHTPTQALVKCACTTRFPHIVSDVCTNGHERAQAPCPQIRITRLRARCLHAFANYHHRKKEQHFLQLMLFFFVPSLNVIM
jgi:hypothetical protein